jgi:hypothetical protein
MRFLWDSFLQTRITIELLHNECFKLFLMSDSTTKEGQERIADYYQVGELWEQMDKKIVHVKDISNCWC